MLPLLQFRNLQFFRHSLAVALAAVPFLLTSIQLNLPRLPMIVEDQPQLVRRAKRSLGLREGARGLGRGRWPTRVRLLLLLALTLLGRPFELLPDHEQVQVVHFLDPFVLIFE